LATFQIDISLRFGLIRATAGLSESLAQDYHTMEKILLDFSDFLELFSDF